MTSADITIYLMRCLLEEMTSLGDRLDGMQREMNNYREVVETACEENRQYRNILETLPQRFFLKDEHLHYVLCSEMYARDLNRTVDDVIGQEEEDLLPVELAKSRREQEVWVLKSGKAVETEETLHVNGRQKVFITIKSPLKDDGRIVGIFGVSVDITGYWQKMAELENLNRQMDNLLAIQSQQIIGLQSNLEYVISGMRQQEKESRELSASYENHIALRDAELAQLRDELQHTPKGQDELIETLRASFFKLQHIVNGVWKDMDRLKNE